MFFNDVYDLNYLQDATKLVDDRLRILDKRAEDSPDPDQFGIFDQIEYITGFGFVACQTYITATFSHRKLERQRALDFGPRHENGRPIVALVNACANYWKHSAEWPRGNLSARAKKTLESIASFEIDTSDSYPISCALCNLLTPCPATFAAVLPLLIAWRDLLPQQIRCATHT